MAITPTYSWPLPDDTDLVKDGAEAIRDLGNAIDTTVGGLSGAGLVHIETQTFSAVSAVNFNNVFSADYDNYEIVYNNILTASGAAYINIRLRNAGTDDSSTNYLHQQLNVNDTAITGVRTTSQTSFLETAEFTNTFSNIAIIRIYNPFIAQPTSGYTVMARGIASGILLRNRAYGLNTTTSYDGFSAIASASTLTGSISVFGYRKS
jgi:hypothetical protein